MARCNSCGGVLGRDCFNPMDCAMISAREDSYERQRLYTTEEKLNRLIEILQEKGIDVSELIEPVPVEPKYILSNTVDDLPF